MASTTIQYTSAQCVAKIQAIDADLDNVAAQPSRSTIRGTSIGLGRTHGDLERERVTWTQRLRHARMRGL